MLKKLLAQTEIGDFPQFMCPNLVDLFFESAESVNGNVTIFSFLSSIGALIGILTKIITF